MRKDSRIYVAGHRGLAGSALVRNLTARGYSDIVVRTRAEVDLADRAGADFVVVGTSTLDGIVFDDVNGNGVRDPGDRGLAGIDTGAEEFELERGAQFAEVGRDEALHAEARLAHAEVGVAVRAVLVLE